MLLLLLLLLLLIMMMMVSADMQLWRSEFNPFMRRAQMRYCYKLIVVPLCVFHQMAESIGDPKGELMFVVNAGRSGSTIVMKVINHIEHACTFYYRCYM